MSSRGILRFPLINNNAAGLGDLNSGRILITENYLLRCHEIFAVCAIGRATTDDGVANVLELAKKAELSNVGIICTKSDVSFTVLIKTLCAPLHTYIQLFSAVDGSLLTGCLGHSS